MFFERLKVATKTLRFRLMLWNAGVVLLTTLVMLVGLREGVRRALLNEMDQRLIDDLKEVDIGLAGLGPQAAQQLAAHQHVVKVDNLLDELNRKALGHKNHGWFVQLLDTKGQELWSSEKAPAMREQFDALKDLHPKTLLGYRIVQSPVQQGNPLIQVRVGETIQTLVGDMDHIDRTILSLAMVALCIAPLGGYWLAGRATKLLAVIINTTARLRPTKLDERLPIRNTGDELDQLSQTVNGLLDRIAKYLEQRQDFLANSAHELRTPLTAIRSVVEVAISSDRGREEYEELLGSVIDECTSLEMLVQQLLLLAETDTARLTTHGEFINLSEVVIRSVEMFRAAAESRGIEIIMDVVPGVTIQGKRHHLRQVMNNLLDNGLKFTPPPGRLIVELAVDEKTRQAMLSVKDTGVGIPPEDLPRVFERFFRGDRSHTKIPIGGTGLGLSICQAVVQAHGGNIFIESGLGKGTRVTVMLPLAPDDAKIVEQETLGHAP